MNVSPNQARAHAEGDCWPQFCPCCASEEAAERCDVCDGEGHVAGAVCAWCEGEGRIEVER